MVTVFIPGEWYLTVFCSGCKQRIPVFRDMNEGKSHLVRGYDLVCPNCQHQGGYDADQVQHYQHPQDLPLSLEPLPL